MFLVSSIVGCTSHVQGPDELEPPPIDTPEQICAHVAASDVELPQWDVFLDLEDWDALLVDVYADVKVDALLCVDGAPHAITLELQGASTRKHPKKSFDLKLKNRSALSGSPFFHDGETGIPRAMLKAMFRDATLVRESIAFELWQMLGHDAPRTDHVNLRINGSDRGLYVLVEPVDETYLQHHAHNPEGTLYKGVRENKSWADFKPGRDLYLAFQNKSAEPTEEWTDLEALVHPLQRTPLTQAAFLRDIDPIFSLDAYMDRMLWVSFTQNSDAIAQNFYLHNRSIEDESADWHIIPWDSNLCLGAVWNKPNEVSDASTETLIDGGNYFSKRLLQIPELRDRYVARYREALETTFAESALLEIQSALSARVAKDLARDQAIWKRMVSPTDAADAVAKFLRERPAHIDEALHDLVDDEEDDDDESEGREDDSDAREHDEDERDEDERADD